MMRDIWVDFNDVQDSSNWVTAPAGFAEPGVDLSVGAHLVAGDEDGNICDAYVLENADGFVRLSLDLGTFRHASATDHALTGS